MKFPILCHSCDTVHYLTGPELEAVIYRQRTQLDFEASNVIECLEEAVRESRLHPSSRHAQQERERITTLPAFRRHILEEREAQAHRRAQFQSGFHVKQTEESI